ncbi:MAG: hypothetical protein M1825_002769 [Sarcosagium campestre]|nr:MAG: hypothetical protein M1825_002769 [Sarcosagium campestre]
MAAPPPPPPPPTLQINPRRGLSWIQLGASLHDVLTRLKAQPQAYPSLELLYSPTRPLLDPVVITLPANGIRLRFDGPRQRLRLIEVIDFSKTRLSYKNSDVVRLQSPSHGTAAAAAGATSQVTGPSFRHVYHNLFGPAFPGEYLPPVDESDEKATGTYFLSYPGVAFSFPVLHSAWSAGALSYVTLLCSSAASPASSMALFSGNMYCSWSDVRKTMFASSSTAPRPLSPTIRGKQHGPAEIELARIHGEGRIEFRRRSAPPFWVILSQTTAQDLIAELGPPDAIYRKTDRRLAIHGTRRQPSGKVPTASEALIDTYDGSSASVHVSADTGSDGSGYDDDDDDVTAKGERESGAMECFYNYFRYGFDVLISTPTTPSPAPPSSATAQTGHTTRPSTNHLTATKVLLHGNVPGSYPFNRHSRCQWSLDYPKTSRASKVLDSEMTFEEVAVSLREIWKSTYDSIEQERQSQRGMVLNRGWGDSPGSSCELLGGWEEGLRTTGTSARVKSDGEEANLGNTELFGFPGLVFEVLKNGAISCLTVF